MGSKQFFQSWVRVSMVLYHGTSLHVLYISHSCIMWCGHPVSVATAGIH